MAERNELISQLDHLHQERYRGAIVRARADKFLLGEQPTRRALAEEKKYAQDKEITMIRHNGTVSGDKTFIENAFLGYYKQLFGGCQQQINTDEIDSLLQGTPQLTDDKKECLVEPITLGEIERAIDGSPAYKTPGPDGISAEFYLKFKDLVAPFFLEVICEA